MVRHHEWPDRSSKCCRNRESRNCAESRPGLALREIADDVVDHEGLKENLIGTLQRVDEHSEAEEEAETLALLADPTHMQMSEQELVRALQSDRDGGQEERY